MIIIYTGGNQFIGVGHLSRCKSIFLELKKENCEALIIAEADKNLANEFYCGLPFYSVNNKAEAFYLMTKFLSGALSADRHVLVTDILGLTFQDNKNARKIGFSKLVHLNDSGMPAYEPDFMVDCELFNKQWILNDVTTYLRGGRYHILRPDILPFRRRESWAGYEVNSVLICFGGADPGHYTELFMDFIKEVHTAVHFTVVLGPAVSRDRKMKITSTLLDNVRFEIEPASLGEIIAQHDVVVTLGGLTSYESMYIGIPVAAMCWSNMQYYVEQLDREGYLINLGSEKQAFYQLLKTCKDVEKLKAIAEKAYLTLDGLGASRVAKCISQIFKV